MCFQKNILKWFFVFQISYSGNTLCLWNHIPETPVSHEIPIPESPKIIKDNSDISKNVGVQEEKLGVQEEIPKL